MFILVGCQSIAVEPNPVKGRAACWSQFALNLDIVCACPDITYSMCQAIVFKLVGPEQIPGKGCSVNACAVLIGLYLHVF